MNNKTLTTILACLALAAPCTQADGIAPFTSDGCSAFVDGTLKQQSLWLPCCQAHDFAYWQGGTYQQRLDADKKMRECVAEVGEPAIAALMLAGVRVGGSPYFPTSFRWGYGWPYSKFYGPLTENERQQVRAQGAVVAPAPGNQGG